MDVRSCKNCGRLFNYMGGQPICASCKQKLEDKFVKVKDYIRQHELASMKEISEENEVSVKQLRQWVREERLTFSSKSPVGIECENCGAMIRTGRFCEKCKNNMANDFKGMYAAPKVQKVENKQSKGKDRLRFLDKT